MGIPSKEIPPILVFILAVALILSGVVAFTILPSFIKVTPQPGFKVGPATPPTRGDLEKNEFDFSKLKIDFEGMLLSTGSANGVLFDSNSDHVFVFSSPLGLLSVEKTTTGFGLVGFDENHNKIPTSKGCISTDGSFLVGVGGASILTYDIKTPSSPKLLNEFYFQNSYLLGECGFHETSGLLYIEGYSIISILKVTDPSSPPQVVGEITDITFPDDIEISGDYLFTGEYGFKKAYILSLSNPTNPTILTSIPLSDGFKDVKVTGNELYILTDSELLVYDISSIQSPVLKNNIPLTEISISVIVMNNYVAVSSYYYNINRVRLYDRNTLSLIKTFDVDLFSTEKMGEMSHDGRYIYLPCINKGLQVIDTQKMELVDIGFNTKNGASYAFVVFDNDHILMPFSSISKEIRVINFHDPENPYIEDNITTSGNLHGKQLELYKSKYIIAYVDSKIQILEITKNPWKAETKSIIDPPYIAVLPFSAKGDILGLSGQGEVVLYNISDVKNPVKLSSAPTGGSYVDGLIFVKDVVFAAERDLGIVSISIKDPKNPSILDVYPKTMPPGRGIFKTRGNYLFFTANSIYSDVDVFDISNPSSISHVAQYKSPTQIIEIETFRNALIMGLDLTNKHDKPRNFVNLLDITDPPNPGSDIKGYYTYGANYDVKVIRENPDGSVLLGVADYVGQKFFNFIILRVHE
jgi:hypothetical protein